MHPALSVIVFSITAGAGYGLLILLVLARYTGLASELTSTQVVIMGILGLVLVTIGLLASTFHLANPKNAWRSFTRFRTSWLSREAVFAVLFYPVCLLWLLAEWRGGGTAALLLGLLTLFIAVLVVICTSMIYASLKTIRQWHNSLTPVNFMLLGLMQGALILLTGLAVMGVFAGFLLGLTLTLLVLAALVKIAYFAWIGQPAGPSINTALGFTRATVRLLDVGHSSGTFLTDEFGYEVAKTKLQWLRIVCVLLAFALPLLMLCGVLGPVGIGFAGVVKAAVAMASAFAGIFIERWLFFAEARHVVNLYHGAQRT